ncbi:carbamoyltransferase C-terminal domain-containing protein [Saccharopolyspora pogona]|uniref:carbamoyltransferase C-terminal domain-containing protein n=1 Tax=Saccharopolyspora pogona TaxID=333966 RepID=UPI00168307E2|nr:carbamoyltransferase C-terminal domain-containing protein [Saccharopolyspora pogona]
MWVLGLNAPPLGWHDSAACLVDGDGVVHALIEQERISRNKHAIDEHPRHAASACLAIAGIRPEDIDVVAVGWDAPRHATRADFGHGVLGRPWQFGDSRNYLETELGWRLDARRHPELVFVPHHRAHAAASFYASGYPAAAVLVVDGHGDDESVSIFDARQGRPMVCRERLPIPDSLGYMYDAVSEMIGLSFLEAGKTMGLAAYGRAQGLTPWPMLEIRDGEYRPPFALPANATQKEIVMGWWDHIRSLGYRRNRVSSQQLADDLDAVRLAHSAQTSLQEAMTMLATRARTATGHENLCLSGGVALNCSANGLLPQPVFVPPVPHDAGVALGAAWSIVPPRLPADPITPYLGRVISRTEIDDALSTHGLAAKPVSPGDIAERLAAGQFGAIVVGRAEIGPRALSHRSIVASATDKAARDRLNRLKGRELWRPLCPVALPECDDEYWSANPMLHRYMVGASQVTERAYRDVPAIVHVDGTVRPQVMRDRDELMWSVLDRLRAGGVAPVAINTSFNQRGEPIVDDAQGAIRSALAIGLDFVVLEDRCVDLATNDRSE